VDELTILAIKYHYALKNYGDSVFYVRMDIDILDPICKVIEVCVGWVDVMQNLKRRKQHRC